MKSEKKTVTRILKDIYSIIYPLKVSDLLNTINSWKEEYKDFFNLRLNEDREYSMDGSYESSWQLVGDRYETDQEYEKRILREKRQRESNKKTKEKQKAEKEERDRQEYERLKAKYG